MKSFLQITWHLGQIKPDMFSTTPIMGISVLWQNVISFRTSNKLTSCGVVTMIAPVIPHGLRYWAIDKCSSDVPGGVSIKRYSSSSQSTSRKNCLIKPVFFAPRQITASSSEGNRKPIDIKLKFSSTNFKNRCNRSLIEFIMTCNQVLMKELRLETIPIHFDESKS